MPVTTRTGTKYRHDDDGDDRSVSSDGGAGFGLTFPNCMGTLVAGSSAGSSTIGSDAYKSMAEKPTKEVLRAREGAEKDCKAFVPVILGKVPDEFKAHNGGLSRDQWAAAFSKWRVNMVSLCSTLFLLHCLFGFSIDGVGNPFTSSDEDGPAAAGVIAMLMSTTEGQKRLLADWETMWKVLRAAVCSAKHGDLIHSALMLHAGASFLRVAQVVSGLVKVYASLSTNSACDALRKLMSLAESPIQEGGVQSRVEALLAETRLYQHVFTNAADAMDLNVAMIFELFRSRGLGHAESAAPLKALAMAKCDLKGQLTKTSSVEELAGLLDVFVTADSSVCTPVDDKRRHAADWMRDGSGAFGAVHGDELECWSCEGKGHSWFHCKDQKALKLFKTKYAAPPPQASDSRKERRARVAYHRSLKDKQKSAQGQGEAAEQRGNAAEKTAEKAEGKAAAATAADRLSSSGRGFRTTSVDEYVEGVYVPHAK